MEDNTEEERRYMREAAAMEAILHNQEVMAKITLEEMLPQVHERIDGDILTHHMSDDDCSDFSAPEDALNGGYTNIFTTI